MKHIISCISLMLFSLLLFSRVSAEAKTVNIYYFFNNPCASCNEEKEFGDRTDEVLKGVEKNIPYRIFAYNLFHQEGMESFKKACDKFNIPAADRQPPMVLINGRYLTGKDNIEKNMKAFFLETAAPGTESSGFFNNADKPDAKDAAGSRQTAHQPVDPGSSYFVYFHTVSCEDCNRTESFLSSLEKNYTIAVNGQDENSPLVIESRNLADMKEVTEIHAYFDAYHVPVEKQQVPIVFYKGGYLSGYAEIKAQLLTVIKSGVARNFTYPGTISAVSELTAKNLPAIFLAGLVNGINPCSISMAFLLLTLLLSKNANILKLGMSYVTGKIITYFVLGTVLYQLISLLDSTVFQSVQLLMKGFLLLLILGLVLLNFWDMLAAKKEKYQNIKVQLPRFLRRINHGLIKKLETIPLKWAMPVVFGLGILISAGEFLCTGQIYLATILYLVKTSPDISFITAAAFAVYVLAMSIPLIVLIFLVNRGKQIFEMSEFTRKNLPVIKLINAIVFLLFGAYIILKL